MVDRGGDHDFSPIEPFLAAQRRHQILLIWDLCHYGYPDDLDPYGDAFPERFAAYARAAAEHVAERQPHGPYFFTPMNEITFFGYMAGEWGWAAPFGKDRDTHRRFTLALCRADIAGAKAIREVLPEARMVHIDPLILVVPPRDRPDLADEAWRECRGAAHLAGPAQPGDES